MDFNKLINKEVDKNIKSYLQDPFKNIPDIKTAIEISKKYGIDLHPRYLYYWNELSASELISFLEFVEKKIKIKSQDEQIKIEFPLNKEKKKFEIIGIEHIVKSTPIENITNEENANIIELDNLNSRILFVNLGINLNDITSIDKIKKQIEKIINYAKENLAKTSVEILNANSKIGIRDKAGTYIGARMGRPEKAKMRKQFNDETKSHGLFPTGEGEILMTKRFNSNDTHKEVIANRSKNLISSLKTGYVEELFRVFFCEKCNKKTIYPTCESCESKTLQIFSQKYTNKELPNETEDSVHYQKIRFDTNELEKQLRNILGKDTKYPKAVKGITSTINKHHTTEHICKAFLRALNHVYVNKDGTVRYDMIEMGLTHFKAKEIGTSVDKLKELGYTHDYLGIPLVNDEQLIEIFPQDVILPDCIESGDEFASDYIINTANYVDDLLEKFYKLPRFYNFKTKEDTIGHLIIGLAPHTSAGIVGRIIGYSKTQGCFSHPVWHAAQRRNLDGDENGIMLLLDGLINFSREYLPDRRGSRSVTADTILFLEEEGELKTVAIGDFIDEKFKFGNNIEDDGFETLNVKDLKTFSFDENGKVRLENISKLIRHINDKKIFEIKTSDGWIKTTQDHSIFSFDFKTGNIFEKRADELKKGDFIVSLGKIELEKNDFNSVNINDLGIKIDIREVQIPKQIHLNESFFRLLGFIYAEGHINADKIEIGNCDKKVINIISQDIEKILNYKPSTNEDRRVNKYTNGIFYRINLPTQFVKVLKKLGLSEERAKSKEIADFVYRTSKENINAFLEGYMLGDGTSYLEDIQRKSIRLYTSSIKLASGLSLLAYLVGKKSTCRKSDEKKTNSQKYEVFISDYKPRSSFWSVYHLRTKINDGLKKSGFDIKERNNLLANICQNKRIKSSSKQKINKIISALSQSPENKRLIQILISILNQDVRLEIVNDIKEVSYEGFVYDLEVPKYQNFLCGPHPIFAHNTMDVSLVLTSHLYLDQIDDEVHGMDIVPYYPMEFYEACKNYVSPKSVKIEKVSNKVDVEDLDEKYLGYGFTHSTDDMNNTVMCSSYKSVPTMVEKLDLQLGLGKKIRAVDHHQVGSFIIDKHFMKDIKGNLRKFSMQTFRCTKCNTKYRRPPLVGKCTNCGNSSINFTISEGSIKKYLKPSFKIISQYKVDPYIIETLELVNLRVEGVFGKEEEKQKNLSDFFGK